MAASKFVIYEPEGLSRAKRLQPQEWAANRRTIEDLYVHQDKTVDDVMAIMASEHGFNANRRQYNEKFRLWKMQKNVPGKVVRSAIHKAHDNPQRNSFSWKEQPIPEQQRARYRQRHPSFDPGASPAPSTPSQLDWQSESDGARTPMPNTHLSTIEESSLSRISLNLFDVAFESDGSIATAANSAQSMDEQPEFAVPGESAGEETTFEADIKLSPNDASIFTLNMQTSSSRLLPAASKGQTVVLNRGSSRGSFTASGSVIGFEAPAGDLEEQPMYSAMDKLTAGESSAGGRSSARTATAASSNFSTTEDDHSPTNYGMSKLPRFSASGKSSVTLSPQIPDRWQCHLCHAGPHIYAHTMSCTRVLEGLRSCGHVMCGDCKKDSHIPSPLGHLFSPY